MAKFFPKLGGAIRLEEWAVVGGDAPYNAPEERTCHLAGQVYGHPDHSDGKRVLTSYVMHADGRLVYTLNNKYVLGTAKVDYLEWYEDRYGRKLNENNPFGY